MRIKLLIFLLFFSICNVSSFPDEISFEVPVLSVIPGISNSGKLSRLPFKLVKTNDNQALRISISDNTPMGAGPSIRSSIWVASLTAALQKNMTLTGVKISIEFSGPVDGPSAGGMICLAVLSALDSRKIPSDFAMTGTILPDGTIGLVGGVAEKLKGAARLGIKRVCIPSFQRFELQQDGSNTDLFDLADNLGIKLLPVENVQQAYAYMHRLAQPQVIRYSERDILSLDKNTEKILIKQYNELQKKIVEIVQKLPKEELDDLRADSILWEMFSTSKAEAALRSGRLLIANQLMLGSLILWQAREKNKDDLQTYIYPNLPALAKQPDRWSNSDYKQQLSSLNQFSKKIFWGETKTEQSEAQQKKNEERKLMKLGYRPDIPQMKEISAQLELLNNNAAYFAFFLYFDRLTPESYSELDNDGLVAAFNLETIKFLFLNIENVERQIDRIYRPELSLTMKQIKPKNNYFEIENLFYQAWHASSLTITSDVIQPLANAADIKDKEAERFFQETDLYYSIYFFGVYDAYRNHENLSQTSKLENVSYHAIASMHSQVDQLVSAMTISLKYGPEIDASLDENDQWVYKNSDFIRYMISSARAQALQSIKECKENGIPCLSPLRDFEEADFERDNPDADKIHEVLANYWRAGLNAKALLMSFK